VLNHLFRLPLSAQAFSQLQALMENLNLDIDSALWSYAWGSNNFSASKAYKRLVGHHLYILFSDGSRKHIANQNTRSFFGCS
jgi:hypothetical protein